MEKLCYVIMPYGGAEQKVHFNMVYQLYMFVPALEKGYKEGTAYVGGKVVPDVGGGICQVSSTLYNTALLANLEITERSNHLFETSYVAPSRDATVYWGSIDFKFKNTRSYPIKIVGTAKNGVVKIDLYGIKEKEEYEVVIESEVISYIPNETEYKKDSTLESGKKVVEQVGFNGCKSKGYRILKKNGVVISRTLLSTDTYSPQNKVVRVGTKKVTTNTQTQTQETKDQSNSQNKTQTNTTNATNTTNKNSNNTQTQNKNTTNRNKTN